jgi:hypothetical protein
MSLIHNQSNHYAVLGIHYNASEDDIKRAYKKKAQKYNPDGNKDPRAKDWLDLIKQAFEVLGDIESRATYDMHLQEETQRRRYECWTWEREQHRRQQEEIRVYYEDHIRRAVTEERERHLAHIEEHENEIKYVKATNSKLWDQVSCQIAKIENLQREKMNLEISKEQFEMQHCQEQEYVSKIRILESTIASLKMLADQSKKDKLCPEAWFAEYEIEEKKAQEFHSKKGYTTFSNFQGTKSIDDDTHLPSSPTTDSFDEETKGKRKALISSTGKSRRSEAPTWDEQSSQQHQQEESENNNRLSRWGRKKRAYGREKHKTENKRRKPLLPVNRAVVV